MGGEDAWADNAEAPIIELPTAFGQIDLLVWLVVSSSVFGLRVQ